MSEIWNQSAFSWALVPLLARAVGSQENLLLLPLWFVMSVCQLEKQTGMFRQRHKMEGKGRGRQYLVFQTGMPQFKKCYCSKIR